MNEAWNDSNYLKKKSKVIYVNAFKGVQKFFGQRSWPTPVFLRQSSR